MTNTDNSMPFNIVFLDEPLPRCFNQKPGMTYKDLLTIVSREFKNTFSWAQAVQKGKNLRVKKSVEGVRAELLEEIKDTLGDSEYSRFESVFEDLKQETDYTALKSSAYIGNSKNARNHMGANNLLEWMFSADGRIDACFIQKDGVKFIFILGVRLSNHYNKKDAQIHEQNRQIAEALSSAFDQKNGNDSTGILRAGLLAYQHEILQNTNTVSAQFETLLVTLEQLIASNDSVQEKIDVFKRDFALSLKHVDEKEFRQYIEERLLNGPLKQYQKELFEKLYHYEYGNDELNEEIQNSFARIQLVKATAPSLFNRAIDLLDVTHEDKTPADAAQDILDCFRILHKIPASHIYVMTEEFADTSYEIEDEELKTKLEQFVSALEKHKNNYASLSDRTPFQEFKNILQHVQKSRFSVLEEAPVKEREVKQNPLLELLNIDVLDISSSASQDKIASALMKLIVEEEDQSVSTFVEANKSFIHRTNKNALYRKIKADTFSSLLKEVFENKKITDGICERYPYLTDFVTKIQKGEEISCLDELNTACEYYTEYAKTGYEDFFIEANQVLKEMSPQNRLLLKGYLKYVYSCDPNNENISELIDGSLDIISEFSRINELKKVQKETMQALNAPSKDGYSLINPTARIEFENCFKDFLMDMGSVEIYEELKEKTVALTTDDLNALKSSEGELGAFIKDYIRYRSQRKKPPFSTLIEKVLKRDEQKRRERFEEALNNYFESMERATAKNELALSYLCLDQKDKDYFLNKWRKNVQANELKLLFLEPESSFEAALKKIDSRIIKEKRAILKTFENHFDLIVEKGKVDELDEFVRFLNKLKNIDLDMLQYVENENENASAVSLVQQVLKIKSKSSKTPEKEIKDSLVRVVRRNQVAKRIKECFGSSLKEENKENLIMALMEMDKQDVDAFCTDNANTPPFKLFFSKLRKLKNKGQVKTNESDISELIDSTARRLQFYNDLFVYLDRDELKKDDITRLSTICLDLTGQDQKEIEAEQPNNMIFPVLFSRINDVKKDEQGEQKALTEYLKNNRWELEFYFTFDSFPRDEDGFQREPDKEAFSSILANTGFDKAYYMLLQKHPVKPRILSLSLKTKCFLESYFFTVDNPKDEKAQEQLKKISLLMTKMDIGYLAGGTDDPRLLEYLACLMANIKMSLSPDQKETAVQYAISGLLGKNSGVLPISTGLSLPILKKGGMGPKD